MKSNELKKHIEDGFMSGYGFCDFNAYILIDGNRYPNQFSFEMTACPVTGIRTFNTTNFEKAQIKLTKTLSIITITKRIIVPSMTVYMQMSHNYTVLSLIDKECKSRQDATLYDFYTGV